MENAIPPEEHAAASDVSPVPMEPSATRKIRERVWIETKSMIGSEEEDAECYRRFLEENPIITTVRYPLILKRLKQVGTDRRDPKGHFFRIARNDVGCRCTHFW